ncbi:unnamed protein product [Thlaspi arvense]|uniref:Protein kinase domain-containing protein n=1 Tax=Thlaspi arvense TaxID=13288 RepID=A0AAU9TD86_THLAR|nr:unnamed protein product [Thlaspi arvense]
MQDITVSNTLVDSNANVELADFGISASMYGVTAGAITATPTAAEAQLDRPDLTNRNSLKRVAEGGQGEFSSGERSTMLDWLVIVEAILDVHSRKIASMIALHHFMIYLFIIHLFHSNRWRG